MAGLDVEETKPAIEAIRQIALRFGSTRGLNQTLLLTFLYGMAHLDNSHSLEYAAAGVIMSLLVLWSFHKKPHIDRQATGEIAPKEDPKP